MATQIIVGDDHPLFRAALRASVSRQLPEAEIVDAEDMAGLRAAADSHPDADLVLLDLHMPGALGFSSLVWLRSQHPGIAVIVISGAEGPGIAARALRFGASGYLAKSASPEAIAEAIACVLDGGLWFPPEAENEAADEDTELANRLASLTPQQFRVLMMVAEGLLNKQIAYELGISEATIKAHVTAILRKLGLYSRTQAAVIAERLQVHPLKLSAQLPPAEGG